MGLSVLGGGRGGGGGREVFSPGSARAHPPMPHCTHACTRVQTQTHAHMCTHMQTHGSVHVWVSGCTHASVQMRSHAHQHRAHAGTQMLSPVPSHAHRAVHSLLHTCTQVHRALHAHKRPHVCATSLTPKVFPSSLYLHLWSCGFYGALQGTVGLYGALQSPMGLFRVL